MGVINHVSSILILKFSFKTVVYPLCFLISNRIRLDHCYWACHHDKVEMQNFQSPASLPHYFCWMRHCSWAGSHKMFDFVVLWANHLTSHFSIIPRPTWKIWSTGRGRVLLMVGVVIKPIVLHVSVPASAGLSYASDHTMQSGKKKKMLTTISCQAVVTCEGGTMSHFRNFRKKIQSKGQQQRGRVSWLCSFPDTDFVFKNQKYWHLYDGF